MTDRLVISIGVHHADGSASSRYWSPVTPEVQAAVAALLGPPSHEVHIPADAVTRFVPQIETEVVTVARDSKDEV